MDLIIDNIIITIIIYLIIIIIIIITIIIIIIIIMSFYVPAVYCSLFYTGSHSLVSRRGMFLKIATTPTLT